MKDRVGESFPGVITAVTGFGLFVELTDIYVEGLVHVTALPGDYYHFDPVHHRLAGERTVTFPWAIPLKCRSCVSISTSARSTSACPDKPAEPAGRKKRGETTSA